MFASLGGETPTRAKKLVADPDDEFHLGNIEEDKIEQQLVANNSDLDAVLKRYPLELDELNRLEGEEKSEKSNELYRRYALREKQLNKWALNQCAPLLEEYHECFSSTRIKIPFFHCSTEQSAYSHCLEVARKATRAHTKQYHAKQSVIWSGWLSSPEPPKEQSPPL